MTISPLPLEHQDWMKCPKKPIFKQLSVNEVTRQENTSFHAHQMLQVGGPAPLGTFSYCIRDFPTHFFPSLLPFESLGF